MLEVLRSASLGKVVALAAVSTFLACSKPVPRPTGVAFEYESAKEMFQRGRFDRAIEFTDGLVTASPPNEFTERARVLRAALLGGHVRAYKELADAYAKGAEATKNPRFKGEYSRLRHDYLQYASRAALGLGELSHAILNSTGYPAQATLEAPYPTAEGPVTLPALAKVTEGGWIEPEEQESVQVDALRKGIQEALSDLVGADRAKVRAAMKAGPVQISGVDFAIYMGRQLLEGASVFDRTRMRDSQKLKVLAGQAEEAAKAALAMLKEKPDAEKEKEVRKLQEQIKNVVKRL